MLKQLKNKLRPYNFFIATFAVEDTSDPILMKILYNDFPVVPDLYPRNIGTGTYTIEIINFDDLNINTYDNVFVGAELLSAGSPSQRMEGYLDINHNIVYLFNYELVFSSTENLKGTFVISYFKLN
jgi:hypothetical protein